MPTDLEALGQLVKRAQYRNHRAMDDALSPVGVSLVQWDALRAIARRPHASGHDLAVATFQSDQAFGTLAARLQDRGLVERTAGRGRRVEHSLTAAGAAAFEAGEEVASETLSALFGPLAEADRRALQEILTTLLRDESAPGAATPT